MKPSCTQLCALCGNGQLQVCETLIHAMVYCAGSKGIFSLLQNTLESYMPGIIPIQILTLDYDLPPHLELPLTWVTAATLSSLWTQRKEGAVSLARLRGELEEGCLVLQKCKMYNDYIIVSECITSMLQ